MKQARPCDARRIWLFLTPFVLSLPALLFLGVGSFAATSGLQEFFSTGAGPKILMGFGVAALLWIAWQSSVLLPARRAVPAQSPGEPLTVHRFRLATALGSGTTGVFFLHRGLGSTGHVPRRGAGDQELHVPVRRPW
ncbi:hypothetical protein ABTY20_06940 [Streptomyces sp. NPDC126497]|uniref:hypothetical protein n=1 Tax=Streptomyces sp. NPDC126497 TaxID=3155313 RepID=UPI00332ED42A